jgi:hypothetical protein
MNRRQMVALGILLPVVVGGESFIARLSREWFFRLSGER